VLAFEDPTNPNQS
jgi:Ion transport protein